MGRKKKPLTSSQELAILTELKDKELLKIKKALEDNTYKGTSAALHTYNRIKDSIIKAERHEIEKEANNSNRQMTGTFILQFEEDEEDKPKKDLKDSEPKEESSKQKSNKE